MNKACNNLIGAMIAASRNVNNRGWGWLKRTVSRAAGAAFSWWKPKLEENNHQHSANSRKWLKHSCWLRITRVLIQRVDWRGGWRWTRTLVSPTCGTHVSICSSLLSRMLSIQKLLPLFMREKSDPSRTKFLLFWKKFLFLTTNAGYVSRKSFPH